jgi:hypothetical protein
MKRFYLSAVATTLATLLAIPALAAPPAQAPLQAPVQAPVQAPAKVAAVQAPIQSPVQKGGGMAAVDSGYRSFSYQPGASGYYYGTTSRRSNSMYNAGFRSAGWKVTGN